MYSRTPTVEVPVKILCVGPRGSLKTTHIAKFADPDIDPSIVVFQNVPGQKYYASRDVALSGVNLKLHFTIYDLISHSNTMTRDPLYKESPCVLFYYNSKADYHLSDYYASGDLFSWVEAGQRQVYSTRIWSVIETAQYHDDLYDITRINHIQERDELFSNRNLLNHYSTCTSEGYNVDTPFIDIGTEYALLSDAISFDGTYYSIGPSKSLQAIESALKLRVPNPQAGAPEPPSERDAAPEAKKSCTIQ